jgi:hypothetical protein
MRNAKYCIEGLNNGIKNKENPHLRRGLKNNK